MKVCMRDSQLTSRTPDSHHSLKANLPTDVSPEQALKAVHLRGVTHRVEPGEVVNTTA